MPVNKINPSALYWYEHLGFVYLTLVAGRLKPGESVRVYAVSIYTGGNGEGEEEEQEKKKKIDQGTPSRSRASITFFTCCLLP